MRETAARFSLCRCRISGQWLPHHGGVVQAARGKGGGGGEVYEFRVQGLGFGVWGWVWGLGFRTVKGSDLSSFLRAQSAENQRSSAAGPYTS